ncbi:MAG: N-6 DNA methylase [Prevotella sp.]|jgi:type I restriction-modification system DNA methylase subunit|nr:N-6 DNA methylase [Prevotella sp.]
MDIKEVLKIFDASDIRLLPESIMNSLQDEYKRNAVYKSMLELNGNDLSYDWFNSIYEDELAQRNQNKQDFTPNKVGVLLSQLTATAKGRIYEPTAGNGSLLITNWWYRKTQLGDDFKSSEHPIECWELSDRSIPILLFNLSIRGINAVVYHGDVIAQDTKAKYTLTNVNDTPGEFSTITKN